MTSTAPANPPEPADRARPAPEPVVWQTGDRGSLLANALGWDRWSPAEPAAAMRLGDALAAFIAEHPGRPLLLVAADFALPPHAARALAWQAANLPSAPCALSVLSNAEPGLDPFSGLDAARLGDTGGQDATADSAERLSRLVALLGTGSLLEIERWPAHAALLAAAAMPLLASEGLTAAAAASRLRDAGGRLLVSDSLFVADARRPVGAAPEPEPHEQHRPPAWGLLAARLAAWLESGAGLPFEPATEAQPATLHITHSWGGGVARWVESFIDADRGQRHFQLRAEGPRSGQGAGQRLSLYAANQLQVPVASWWLNPAIASCTPTNGHYREILDGVLRRYGIGRILVSSLVGHSLDALRSGLPTVQVLHDHFPRWPLLGVNPEGFPGMAPDRRLAAALQQHELLPDFRERDAAGWSQLAGIWRESIARHRVRVIAPSRSAADVLRRLDPLWDGIGIEVVPHGLPPLPSARSIAARERPDGRLRIVVPGRISEGKGQALLLEALPQLTRHAQVYLLGAGKNGEEFFGRTGVNVVLEYRREDLPALLQAIGPHAAALLSVVPETFSYTLSEMRQLGIPVIATRVGSLSERIRHGHDGWLIEPDAAALVQRVAALRAEAGALTAMRAHLAGLEHYDTAAMVAQYARICPVREVTAEASTTAGIDAVQHAAAAEQAARSRARIRALTDAAAALQAEVEKRTEWAQERHRALLEEQTRRERWVGRLQAELDSVKQALATEQRNHAAVLASSSWRLTRPLRAARRVGANLARARAWNPLRWPLLLSQAVRIVSTQGLAGALLRAQESAQAGPPPAPAFAAALAPVGDPEPPDGLPRAEQPVESIVIPVYGKWVYTAACLRSIAAARTATAFEVIVVDDHSRDETPQRLEGIDGLTVIRNRRNLGFVRSCNRGVEAARGRYVVLLNNDTQVLDGWLDALLATFEQFPDTGLAGARLVYPDGRLQEAGGIVFRDGSGWNYGRGDRADRPEYGFVREVDYCSGACIMLPVDLMRRLGGFDARYAPAYYEDTDLAFRVRAAGLKVRLQPAATVVHHEGISSGTDIASGIKRFQQVNRRTFRERWRQQLEQQPEPIDDPEDSARIRRARDHRLTGRVLVIDAYTPQPDQDSGSLRLRYLFDCFQQLGYGVSFFADNRGYDPVYSKALQQAGVEVLYNPWIDSLHAFFRERGAEFDIVLISRHYIAVNYIHFIRRFCPRAKFVFDTVDLHYLREQRLAELENSLPLKRVAAQTRRSELAVVRAADATLVVSPVEQAVLAQDAPGVRVHVLSNIHRATGSRRPFAERKDLFFVGGYQHPPNIDAAQWFVGSIWPRIRAHLPDLRFHLIGSKAPESVRALAGNGVEFHGYVEDLEPWLDGCRLAVAPLRYGAGVKGKVNMSMSRGQPVVATPMAVEGLYATDGVDLLVAEGAADFADAVVRLYGDEALWNRLSAGGLENVRNHFSVETAQRRLAELLDALGD
jgi:GT2 family glycosyltransferase